MKLENKGSLNITVIDINSSSTESQSKNSYNKLMVIFGQHPRELISSETGLYFIEQICQNKTLKNQISDYSIKAIVNSNPQGRQLVEKGNFCNRMNVKNQVDINRNWDFAWQKEKEDDEESQTRPGQKPFSEEESSIINKEISSFRPQIFLDIHSGMRGLLTPFCQKDNQGLNQAEIDNIRKISNQIKDSYCKDCLVGNAYQILHYESFGNAMDYNFAVNKVPLSMAWEIFGDNSGLGYYRFMNMKNKQKNRKLLRKNSISLEEQNECFEFFNPTTEDQYHQNKKNWTSAIIHLLDLANKQK